MLVSSETNGGGKFCSCFNQTTYNLFTTHNLIVDFSHLKARNNFSHLNRKTLRIATKLFFFSSTPQRIFLEY